MIVVRMYKDRGRHRPKEWTRYSETRCADPGWDKAADRLTERKAGMINKSGWNSWSLIPGKKKRIPTGGRENKKCQLDQGLGHDSKNSNVWNEI